MTNEEYWSVSPTKIGKIGVKVKYHNTNVGKQTSCGLTWRGVQKLIQEILIANKVSNPARLTGYENQGQMPNIHMVRRLADRYNLTLRSTMEISKGRQVLRPQKRVMFK